MNKEKHILGLDLGVNSIGWAVINVNGDNDKLESINCLGSRIIPTDGDTLGKFGSGSPTTTAASERTGYRGTRRIGERFLLRRERLHRTLHVLGFLPSHYENAIGWDRTVEKEYGKFKNNCEVKLAWNERNEFLFMNSYEEMRKEFREWQPKIKNISHDWTLYYLRKKALTQVISKAELAWIILNFNQKRGYYQREENETESSNDKKEEFYALKVISVENTGETKGDATWYNVHLENGFIYKRPSKVALDSWIGQIKEFIVTTKLDKDGKDKINKYGEIDRSFRAPSENDWGLRKKKSEDAINRSGKTIGEYIYSSLLANPKQKIKGRLVSTIEREYYKDELVMILNKQKEYHKELTNRELYDQCINELYLSNKDHRNQIASLDFTHLFSEDIIYYHRPLKSKKSSIADCAYESRKYMKDGELVSEPLKCIPKSNPLYQEFRIWQFIKNLKIYERGDDLIDITDKYLGNEEQIVELFEFLNEKESITQKTLLSHYKLKATDYRWNYLDDNDKAYPCNETHHKITKYLHKCDVDTSKFTKEQEHALWHILYSVSDKNELAKALNKFSKKNCFGEKFGEIFTRFPLLKKEYGSYSEKAIKKLLSLMRVGKYWSEELIDETTKVRIDKIITGEYDEKIRERVREKSIGLKNSDDFAGLPIWLACYVAYDRHSEAKDITRWETPEDIDQFIATYSNNAPINPIVKKVLLESLRTVRDILKKVGHIDEIHLELAREMRNTAEEKKNITSRMRDNESKNIRVKHLLSEFKDPFYNINNVREFSSYQQDKLRIVEEDVVNNYRSEHKDLPDYIEATMKKLSSTEAKHAPTKEEVKKYALWLEQNYKSVYTGQIISFSELFTDNYQIEHIIPRARFYDDSFSNKVICESAVNKEKDNMLGCEFISKRGGSIIELGGGKNAKLLTLEEYKQLVSKISNVKKRKNLLMEDIPESFTLRQLNDTRYISSLIKGYLSNIVREEGEQETVSKHLIVCNGGVTDLLKKDWGLNDSWNKLVAPRFARMNTLSGHEENEGPYGYWDKEKNCFITSMPLDQQVGFQKKRIDHRHHAMDAITIACANRNHVNFLNNVSAKTGGKMYSSLKHVLYDYKDVMIKGEMRSVPDKFTKPWATFTEDSFAALNNIIVSQRQVMRIVTKATNRYQRYDSQGKKIMANQESENLYAVRKPLHKESVYGAVNLREIAEVKLAVAMQNPDRIVEKEFKDKLKYLLSLPSYRDNEKLIKKYFTENKDTWSDINLSKIKLYTFSEEGANRYAAKRTSLVDYLNGTEEKKVIAKIESITDTAIQKILKAHYAACDNNSLVAFSSEGIDTMNENIVSLNDGKFHEKIEFVRVFETLGNKFSLGESGNKSSKYVEAAKGTNLFFAIYEKLKEDKKTGEIEKSRVYSSVPFSSVVENGKQGKPFVKEIDSNGNKLLFSLSPNDLVYVPRKDQEGKELKLADIDKSRIYKMVSCTGFECYFIQNHVAKTIVDKKEYSSLNKMGRSIDGIMIKEICIPITVNSLGEITHINGKAL